MKITFSLIALVITAALAQAGGFGGPPPFTNGSPLISGVDGFYQASARGKNLAGVFRFTYADGIQTSAPELPTGDIVSNLITDPYNDYVFFVEGFTYRGLVQANINTNSITGVFDNGSANVPVFGDDAAEGLGILSFMSGFFTGTMDQYSPYASFSGTGRVQVTDTSLNPTPPPDFVLSGNSQVSFKFRGVRAAP